MATLGVRVGVKEPAELCDGYFRGGDRKLARNGHGVLWFCRGIRRRLPSPFINRRSHPDRHWSLYDDHCLAFRRDVLAPLYWARGARRRQLRGNATSEDDKPDNDAP